MAQIMAKDKLLLFNMRKIRC